MGTKEYVIAVYESVEEAQRALTELELARWPGENASLIAAGDESRLHGIAESMQRGDKTEKSAAVGATAGASLGLLAGSSLLMIPGLGPVLFAGAIASGITGGLVGGLVGAMSGWGVKEDEFRRYSDDIKRGKTLLAISGHPSALAEGRALLQSTSAERVTIHATTADSKAIDP